MVWKFFLRSKRRRGFCSQQNGWYSDSKKLVILCSKISVPSLHLNGDSTNTELLFQTSHCVNQISFTEQWRIRAILEGTIIGPVLEVQIVKILVGYGIEIAIPSIVKLANTFYVVKSRETERFVNETHDHKEGLRSRNELLTAERGSNSVKETCASSPSNLVGDSLIKKVNENGLRLMRTLHQVKVCLHRFVTCLLWVCLLQAGVRWS